MSATRIDEIADGLFRIHTPDPSVLGGFSFNQYLLRDEEPLLFHTGPRALFPQVCAACRARNCSGSSHDRRSRHASSRKRTRRAPSARS